MASNSFGTIFKMTTWGESHGPSIGCVIDGCPAGIAIAQGDIQKQLDVRSPGRSERVSGRLEEDKVEILSGVFEGRSTGTPISLLIHNKDQQSIHYEPTKDLLKPGHANFTYLEKYGIFDYRGSGRASARETACRVAAGAIAHIMLKACGIEIIAYLKSMGPITADVPHDISAEKIFSDPFFCPDRSASSKMEELIRSLRDDGDSIGGSVEIIILGCPAGLGDPIYEKMEARLASAMMSINASKGFEIGDGFESARMRGSAHNDLFILQDGSVRTETNHAGGVLAGITTGMPLIFRTYFKPASSIKMAQATLNTQGQAASISHEHVLRHDPCVAVRGVPVCLAMARLVLADAFLMSKIDKFNDI